jgi:hypothetical protein
MSEIVSVKDLLREGVSPGAIVTAIETKGGVWGWDRFRRFTNFALKDDDLEDLLNLLALQAQHDSSDELSPLDHDEGDTALSWFGWEADKRPEFNARSEEPALPAGTQRKSKTDTATLTIVAGLLAFLRGELGNRPHPDWKSQNDLVGLLAEKLRGFPGASPRNIADKFGEANRLLKEP